MKAFRWDENFVTGQPVMDKQHHYLVELINQLGESLADNNLADADVDLLLQQLVDYTAYHFTDEEQMMRDHGVDPRHVQSHQQAHHAFLREVQLMQACLDQNGSVNYKFLLDFLSRWLVYHILDMDQSLGRQIVAVQAGISAEQAFEDEQQSTRSATEPLLAALNGLFEQVSTRNRELVALTESLEAQVKERTQALSEANRHLEALASTDSLTGLANRRQAMSRLDQLWDESQRDDLPLSCILIDADYFKEVNDTFGHDAGDAVLRELASTLRHGVRTDDLVCRLGGDEFLVICPYTDFAGAQTVAQQLHRQVSKLRVAVGSGVWHGSISVGVAGKQADMAHVEALIKVADLGVYAAKRAGRGCVRGAR